MIHQVDERILNAKTRFICSLILSSYLLGFYLSYKFT